MRGVMGRAVGRCWGRTTTSCLTPSTAWASAKGSGTSTRCPCNPDQPPFPLPKQPFPRRHPPVSPALPQGCQPTPRSHGCRAQVFLDTIKKVCVNNDFLQAPGENSAPPERK